MRITIDKYSGFCFGVVYAIQMAEDVLQEEKVLYCLGDIVHNNKEVERLKKTGLKIINHNDLENIKDCTVLIRAHGEPPETRNEVWDRLQEYQRIDATATTFQFIKNKKIRKNSNK